MDRANTHYTQTSLSKKSMVQTIKPQKSSFTRWLQRLFCIREKNEQYITNMMEVSQYDESQQPTMKIINKLPQCDEYFSINDPIRVFAAKNSQFPFVVKFNQVNLSDLDDINSSIMPDLQNKVVLLFTQNPSHSVIHYIESRAQHLIIQTPTLNKDLQEYITNQYANKNFNIPELIVANHGAIFKLDQYHSKKCQSIIDQFIFMPDYTSEGKQFVEESVKQLLKYIPNELEKFTFILNIQGQNIEEVFLLQAKLYEGFIQRYEAQEWINKIIYLSQNRSRIILKQKDQKKNGFQDGSQYIMLSNNSPLGKGFNLSVENTEFAINLNKIQQGSTITLVLKCIINGGEIKKSNQLEFSKFFGLQIFFIRELKQLSQYDQEGDYKILISIINKSSFFSCCLCINILKKENLKELVSLKLSNYRKYIEILISSGLLLNEQDCLNVQLIFNKCLSYPIYEAQIPRIFEQLGQPELNQQQLLQSEEQINQQDKAYSMEYNYAFSEKSSQFILGLHQELNYSELQMEPLKRIEQ